MLTAALILSLLVAVAAEEQPLLFKGDGHDMVPHSEQPLVGGDGHDMVHHGEQPLFGGGDHDMITHVEDPVIEEEDEEPEQVLPMHPIQGMMGMMQRMQQHMWSNMHPSRTPMREFMRPRLFGLGQQTDQKVTVTKTANSVSIEVNMKINPHSEITDPVAVTRLRNHVEGPPLIRGQLESVGRMANVMDRVFDTIGQSRQPRQPPQRGQHGDGDGDGLAMENMLGEMHSFSSPEEAKDATEDMVQPRLNLIGVTSPAQELVQPIVVHHPNKISYVVVGVTVAVTLLFTAIAVFVYRKCKNSKRQRPMHADVYQSFAIDGIFKNALPTATHEVELAEAL